MRAKTTSTVLLLVALFVLNATGAVYSQSGATVYLPAVSRPAATQDPPVQRDGVAPQIVGGQDADPGEYPWQVFIQIDQYVCGGSLIHPQWVMTAAHCMFGEDPTGNPFPPQAITVYLGKHDLRIVEDSQQTRKVVQAIVHPSYDPDNGNRDIALLKLTSPAGLDNTVAVIPLLTSPADDSLVAPNTLTTVTGWGATSELDPGISMILQEVRVPIVSNTTCRQAMPGIDITNDMLCAGYSAGGKDACFGDSGGPLVVPNGPGVWKVAGIISFGVGCARPNLYGVYTRVSQFVSWIQQYIVPPLKISSFTPQRARPGADISIFGEGFLNAAKVSFNDIDAGFTIVSDSIIDAIVPPNVRTGPIKVSTLQTTVSSAANFVPEFEITIVSDGSGTVHYDPPGNICGADTSCIVPSIDGTVVTLDAMADPGFVVAGWLDDCSGMQAVCHVTMDSDKSVTAVFAPPTSTVTVTISGPGSGVVTSTPAGIDCGADCIAFLPTSSAITLTAQPGPGDEFSGWSGACSGSARTCVVTMIGDQAASAIFVNTYELTLTKSGSGVVTSTPAGIHCGSACSATFSGGSTATLTAQPAPGYRLAEWGGSCSGNKPFCVVTMSTDRAVSVTFERSQLHLPGLRANWSD